MLRPQQWQMWNINNFFKLPKVTSYLTLFVVFCDYFGDNWPCYNGTTAYLPRLWISFLQKYHSQGDQNIIHHKPACNYHSIASTNHFLQQNKTNEFRLEWIKILINQWSPNQTSFRLYSNTTSNKYGMYSCQSEHNYIITIFFSLTLKQLGNFCQNVILFSHVVHHEWNILVWNYSNRMNILRTLWILMAWCFCTRASVATVLITHPCVSSCLRVNSVEACWSIYPSVTWATFGTSIGPVEAYFH